MSMKIQREIYSEKVSANYYDCLELVLPNKFLQGRVSKQRLTGQIFCKGLFL